MTSSRRAPRLIVLMLTLSAGAASAAIVHNAALKKEMKQVVEPASNTLFAIGGDVDPANGPDAAKVPAARWAGAASAAAKLKAQARLLAAGKYGKPAGAWAAQSRQMAEISAAAEKAAKAHDGPALSKAANDLSDVCSACHGEYKQQS